MRPSIFTLTAAAGLVSSQCISSIPECAQQCLLTAASSAGCSTTDYTCQCTTDNQSAIQQSATSCVVDGCGEDVAIQSVLPAAQAFCSAINDGQTCSTASPSAVSTTTSTATEATATATATATSTATDVSSSSASATGAVTTDTSASGSSSSLNSTLSATVSLTGTTANATVTTTSSSTASVASGTGSSGSGSASSGTATGATSSASSAAAAGPVESIGSLVMLALGALAFF